MCSLYGDQIGAAGAKHFAEALKVNSTLASMKYAAALYAPTFLFWQSVSSR